MPQGEPLETVFKLEQLIGASWSNIRKARDATVVFHERLTRAVGSLTGEDAAIVLFGSGGRFEVTEGSDPDWTLLVDGQANAKHQVAALTAAAAIQHVVDQTPGREGVFGAIAFSHDLIQYIGGENDTNANLTRRILLLLESKPIGRRDAYDRVLRAVLDRYLSGDRGWAKSRTPRVPRFLLNDIARYWRTMTVDYVYKQWSRNSAGWAIRNAKLRMSRKLIYASGLLYCFSLAIESRGAVSSSTDTRKLEAIERLWHLTNRAPLDLLARAFIGNDALFAQARQAFGAYDRFLQLLGDPTVRDRLRRLSHEDADGDDTFREVRECGKQFQDSLTALFLREKSSRYAVLTEEYGVF